MLLSIIVATAQGDEVIGAANLARLQPVLRIDFADLPGEQDIGFFAAADDASAFVVVDRDGRLREVNETGVLRSWSYRSAPDEQVFALIDAVYVDETPLTLYALDDGFYVNEDRLEVEAVPAAMFSLDGQGEFVIEAVDAAGATIYLRYTQPQGETGITLVNRAHYPASDLEQPQVRIGRIDFPWLILSTLADESIAVFRFPDAFTADAARRYSLEGGPAVAGALNAAGTHFAWSDPGSRALNLLDLDSGENRAVAETGGAYAQYHLLTHDAGVIIVVNLDFAPEVFAWNVESGERHDLGVYRECGRIPDRVALSRDRTALIIGCDSGLEIWRIAPEDEET